MPWSDFQQCAFPNLKKLDQVKFSGAPIGQFLRLSPSLEEYHLDTRDLTADTVVPIPSHTSNLRRLEIYLNGGPAEAWNTLHTPHLVFLSLEPRAKVDRAAIEGVSSMLLQRSEAALQDLKLLHFPAIDTINLIDSHPSLTKITVLGEYDAEFYQQNFGDLFSRLTISGDKNEVILGPNLQSFNIQLVGTDKPVSTPIFVDYIVNMLRSRAPVVDGTSSLSTHRSFLSEFSSEALFTDDEIDDRHVNKKYKLIRARLAQQVAAGLELRLENQDLGKLGA
ncbi:hypothetical protein D9757_004008 [Collybiopsis confluens]|uniref:Uncharacterized protein n=1 Tax=Collybiopsis confluens TaxID=2823264 RepID=A0A8H5HX05_9AGAR|nr:hypothetical protein D9757_004008 [Collybiopsis confluens]